MKHHLAFITLASCILLKVKAKATSNFSLNETDESVNSAAADNFFDLGELIKFAWGTFLKHLKGTFKNI